MSSKIGGRRSLCPGPEGLYYLALALTKVEYAEAALSAAGDGYVMNLSPESPCADFEPPSCFPHDRSNVFKSRLREQARQSGQAVGTLCQGLKRMTGLGVSRVFFRAAGGCPLPRQPTGAFREKETGHLSVWRSAPFGLTPPSPSIFSGC